jgi:hypothetical protein
MPIEIKTDVDQTPRCMGRLIVDIPVNRGEMTTPNDDSI